MTRLASRVTRGTGAGALMVSLLALAGCGGGDQPGASPAPGTSPSTSSSTSSSTATGAGPGIDACTTVPATLLQTDLGLAVGGAGESSPPFYGGAGVTDCAWFDGGVSVSVHATDDAARDLPDAVVQGFLQAGGQAVTGADRGMALVTSNTDGSNVDLIVVRGDRGLEVAAATDAVVSQAQALQLGHDVAAALG